jgi:hypothetical protein
MVTVLWCYLRNSAFKVDGVDYHDRGRPHRPGQPPRRHHRGRHRQAEAAENNGGYTAIGFGKTHPIVYDELTGDHPIDLCATRSPTATWAASADQLRRRLQRRRTTSPRRAHRGDQQARRRHGPDLRPQGVPAPDGRGREAAQRDPGRLPDDDDARRRFWRLWTLKEAWLKARGTGITGALDSTTIDLSPPRLVVARDDDPGAWQLLEPDLLPGYQIGLALRAGEAPQLSCMTEPSA